jgi:hypothetical protein
VQYLNEVPVILIEGKEFCKMKVVEKDLRSYLDSMLQLQTIDSNKQKKSG